MRTLLLKSLFARPVTIKGPEADERGLEELGRALAARGRRLFGRMPGPAMVASLKSMRSTMRFTTSNGSA
jgi:hypothetical protein